MKKMIALFVCSTCLFLGCETLLQDLIDELESSHGGEFENPIVVLDDVDRSPVTGKPGIEKVNEPGWSTPIKLEFNNIG